jgi:hypothetical protein
MMAKYVVLATFVAFVLGVSVLSIYGGSFLHQVADCDTTVSYLDLARQATDRRDYITADAMYKQALMYARQSDPTGQSENAMLLIYAKFAILQRHDPALAKELHDRAAVLRRSLSASSPNAVR